jgi:hypothetical protein
MAMQTINGNRYFTYAARPDMAYDLLKASLYDYSKDSHPVFIRLYPNGRYTGHMGKSGNAPAVVIGDVFSENGFIVLDENNREKT